MTLHDCPFLHAPIAIGHLLIRHVTEDIILEFKFSFPTVQFYYLSQPFDALYSFKLCVNSTVFCICLGSFISVVPKLQ